MFWSMSGKENLEILKARKIDLPARKYLKMVLEISTKRKDEH